MTSSPIAGNRSSRKKRGKANAKTDGTSAARPDGVLEEHSAAHAIANNTTATDGIASSTSGIDGERIFPRLERRTAPREIEIGSDRESLDKRLILQGLNALRRGDFGVRFPEHSSGLDGKIAEAFNEVADLNQRLCEELQRVALVVGKEGRISQRASLGEVRGAWADAMRSMNDLIGDLVQPTSEMARVIGAVARGDLNQSMALDMNGRPLEGEFLKTGQIVNTMVAQLAGFSAEVTRVAREVGTDGKLGGQAKVKGVAGTWKELTDSVNSMAGNLTSQVRNIAQVTTAVAYGDLSKKITVDVRGEFGELKDTINTMVDQLNSFASEVTRVAREVGTDGKLGGQAHVKGVAGTWKDLTDSVNGMAGNLTSQMRNIVDVTKAVANGDLSKKITADAKGEILELKATINTMVDQLNSFASEVTRVAREVGTEGKLGGQADVRGVAGTWKDLTNSVNNMAVNLTAQVRNVAAVTTAVATGDLSKKITVDVRGEMLELKNTINTMVDQLSSFAAEVTRVAREVGTEGKLGGQAQVKGVAGVWKDLTDNVNSMAGNLTSQVRNIATVTTAVASGDLSKKITADVRGEMLQMKNTINVMVDQLNSFATEVTRVAREVGTEGKLGGQAQVTGVAGVWKDLTDSVNSMAGNLTAQVRNIATVTTAFANGDLSKKITVDVRGEMLELKDTINTMVDQLRSFAAEVTRVAREVGTDGKLGGQAMVRDVGGVWKDLTDNVNFMAGNLTSQVRNIAQVTTAVANGDLSKKITVDVRGEMLEMKNTINVMVDQLNSFASEVTRVAREVGTEGRLGGQADVRGVGGVWKDLTDNVNFMAGNLTQQVRGIAKVVTAIANGDLALKFSMEAKGELAALASTINSMIDTLATFADQTTTVAREVGVEGKLGGQASVPGASGTWKDLTENVNRLAANLTTQVRAIGEVATAVTKGDLTRSIKVDAQGELAALKDNVNEMIRNLKDTTVKTNEQDWLKTNLAKFSRMLQGQKDLLTVGKLILSELAPVVGAQQGVFYIVEPATDERESQLRLLASYAYKARKNVDNVFKLGEGLVGQCALEKEKILLANVPHDYITVSSGLGESVPANIIVLPVLFESNVKAVIELASFERFSVTHLAFLDQLTESIGIVLNTIEANMRTEDLLKQSQSLARELQSQQMELQSTNTQLEEKATLLAEQNAEVELKNAEVEQARQALEEKATQLALTSKYKSEFLANMSHELRTPLNSLLILSDHLSKNSEKNLTERQMEFLKTIHSSGTDLLSLINDILDLSKIESGTVVVDVGEVSLGDLMDYVDRTFRHVADSKKLNFEVERDLTMPRLIHTDSKRLQQVLKNLLSNAFKFTERGRVSFSVREVKDGWSPENEVLGKAKSVIAFSVTDTGIGIPAEKQQIIFEAFQQADGSTSRKYGGTGLGLAISRELARLLGGEIRLMSSPEKGSEFTLFLPAQFVQSRGQRKTQELLLPAATSQPLAVREPEEVPELIESLDAGDQDSEGNFDRQLLIVENDASFADFLREAAREKGFRTRVAARGAIAVAMANDHPPDAITLDINLVDMDGWRVLERLKSHPTTRHIPVHIISTEDDRERGLRLGASGILAKPVREKHDLDDALRRLRERTDTNPQRVLVVGGEPANVCAALTRALATTTASVTSCGLEQAIDTLHAAKADVVVICGLHGDATELELIARMRSEATLTDMPAIAYIEGNLTRKGESYVKRLKETAVVREARSTERLIDEAVLFLHLRHSALPEATRAMLDGMRNSSTVLANKKVLIVDDDVRNIFALGTVLEPHGMKMLAAENGRQAIEILQTERDFDAVLMDIMMPEMDGYDTMRAIRKIGRLRALPIIALTAKAMKGDREKCLEAGASDYVSKPVDTDLLLGVLRAWLYR